MARYEYGLSRNMPAKDSHGDDVLLAVALIRHENGYEQTVVIPESLIKFEGEGIIAKEVARAAALPPTAAEGNPLGLKVGDSKQ